MKSSKVSNPSLDIVHVIRQNDGVSSTHKNDIQCTRTSVGKSQRNWPFWRD